MAHVAKMVGKRQVTDGAIAITLRCCDDPATDSTATVYLHLDTDLPGWVAREKQRVENRHAGMQAAIGALEKLR